MSYILSKSVLDLFETNITWSKYSRLLIFAKQLRYVRTEITTRTKQTGNYYNSINTVT